MSTYYKEKFTITYIWINKIFSNSYRFFYSFFFFYFCLTIAVIMFFLRKSSVLCQTSKLLYKKHQSMFVINVSEVSKSSYCKEYSLKWRNIYSASGKINCLCCDDVIENNICLIFSCNFHLIILLITTFVTGRRGKLKLG